MAFYIRYYEDEVLVQKSEEILPYLQSINKLTPEELSIIDKRIVGLRSGTNRIYLDAAKKRYLLVIGTAQTTIEEFQKKAKAGARPQSGVKAEVPEEPANQAEPQKAESNDWAYYYLQFTIVEDEQPQLFTFKAKIRNASMQSAYQQMSEYLKGKHGDSCLIPEFSENIIWSEPIEKGMD